MADFSHLDEMGRELKCPICLGLLKSAASLVCNHVFCNSCILESMKSVSNCPVCKIPFHRREVRPSPHMDNLVSIYRSMEAASGFNIFTTQVVPAPNSSVATAQNQGKKKVGNPERASGRRVNSKRKRFSNKMQNELEADVAAGSGVTKRPTFPAKKRVHVAPYPISETPIPNKTAPKSAIPSPKCDANVFDNKNENQLEHEKADDLLSPFFWLRKGNHDDNDEDAEKPSSQLSADPLTPQFDPCFSDLKGSDCETPSRSTPGSKPSHEEIFDSEMFEWTQRPSSPELFLTPLRKQSISEQSLDVLQEKDDQIAIAKLKVKVHNKKNRKERKPGHTTCIKKTKRSAEAKNSITGKVERKEIARHKAMKMHAGTSSHFQENISGISEEPAVDVTDKHQTLGCKVIGDKKLNSEQKSIRKNKIAKTSKSLCMKSPNKSHSGEASVIFGSRAHDEDNQRPASELLDEGPSNLAAKGQYEHWHGVVIHEKENAEMGAKMEKNVAKTKRMRSGDQIENAASNKEGNKKGRSVKDLELENNKNAAKFCSNTPEVPASSPKLNTKELSHFTKGTSLRRCGGMESSILCAFCQSSCDTEISGEMIHYFNGKPVVEDYNRGINVIHAHKYCTEWAPNVYFKDDIAVNLAAELTRSKKIKCSCCGLKGAALGCFDKGCRRSFHFTCAKATPECRWDCENFVMLCPQHSCVKFPSELMLPPKQQKDGVDLQGLSNASATCKAGQEACSAWNWPSGFPCKWVICCSVLSEEEKVSVSEFTRLTGTTVSKGWSPLVTHVITSVDDNGACRRTLKYLMGILDGKWILTVDWIKACIKALQPVDEEQYEVGRDVNGARDGPRLGRLRVINKLPKLFKGFIFYFSGDFKQSYRGYLHDLVTTAGGVVLQRKPVSRDRGKLLLLDCPPPSEMILIVFNLDAPEDRCNAAVVRRRQSEARALADASGAESVSSAWIIDSIAACKALLHP